MTSGPLKSHRRSALLIIIMAGNFSRVIVRAQTIHLYPHGGCTARTTKRCPRLLKRLVAIVPTSIGLLTFMRSLPHLPFPPRQPAGRSRPLHSVVVLTLSAAKSYQAAPGREVASGRFRPRRRIRPRSRIKQLQAAKSPQAASGCEVASGREVASCRFRLRSRIRPLQAAKSHQAASRIRPLQAA